MPRTLIPLTLSRDDLISRGLRRADIDRAVRSGSLRRARRGRYLPSDVDAELLRAVALGARLDCVSLLRALGVFVLSPDRLHLQVEPHASHLPEMPHDVRLHWRTTERPSHATTTDVESALAEAVRCQEPRAAVATLDSAWHLGHIDHDALERVMARLPRRHRRLRRLLDRRAESGPESLLRLILRSLGCTFATQVVIPGVGRVDFVVDGWLIIECDSKAHHEGWDQQRRDRRRDIAAAKLGYVTIRPIAEDIMYMRDAVRSDIAEILAARAISPENRAH